MSEMALFMKRSARVLPLCAGAMVGGLVSDYRRAMLLRIFRALGLRDIEPRLPVSSIRKLVQRDGAAVMLRELDTANGNVSPLELAVLCKLVADRRPNVIFEIGTFDGRTTLNLASNLPSGGHVYTLDLPRDGLDKTQFAISAGDRHYVDKDASGCRFADSNVQDRITQLYGDSATFDFGPYANTVDMVFIDGAHTYDYVLSDTQRAMDLLRHGRGLIVWHDYDSWPDVTRALHELATQPGFGGMRRVEGTTLVVLER